MDLVLHIFVRLSEAVYEESDKLLYKAEVTPKRSGAKLSSSAVLIQVIYLRGIRCSLKGNWSCSCSRNPRTVLPLSDALQACHRAVYELQ